MGRPSSATVKRLFALSHNCCAFPGCDHPLVEPLSQKVVGRICHIKAASEKGPRFDPLQTDEERHGFSNLVVMCPTHHDVIDHDIAGYPVSRITAIKQEHEARFANPCETELSEDVIQQLIAAIPSGHPVKQQKNVFIVNTVQGGLVQGDNTTINNNFG
jgi:hypothetical protein